MIYSLSSSTVARDAAFTGCLRMAGGKAKLEAIEVSGRTMRGRRVTRPSAVKPEPAPTSLPWCPQDLQRRWLVASPLLTDLKNAQGGKAHHHYKGFCLEVTNQDKAPPSHGEASFMGRSYRDAKHPNLRRRESLAFSAMRRKFAFSVNLSASDGRPGHHCLHVVATLCSLARAPVGGQPTDALLSARSMPAGLHRGAARRRRRGGGESDSFGLVG